ncbi:MAG: hypothetical protein JO267_00535 [Alphaproteobacteria bacterium]|nr:hypothetical protein [Alphaproteobacteria bacterium]
MSRYVIPFAIGLMLGVGSVPLWAGAPATGAGASTTLPVAVLAQTSQSSR